QPDRLLAISHHRRGQPRRDGASHAPGSRCDTRRAEAPRSLKWATTCREGRGQVHAAFRQARNIKKERRGGPVVWLLIVRCSVARVSRGTPTPPPDGQRCHGTCPERQRTGRGTAQAPYS